jgi:hypothetical protein
MPHPIWSLKGCTAHLEIDAFTARLDLSRPQRGLADLQWRSQTFAGQQILAVDLAPHESADEENVADCYQRAGDLVAVYDQTPQRPMRVQIYWRATELELSARRVPAIDLQVSVQTSLLDSRPELTTASTLASHEVCRLVDSAAGAFAPLSPPEIGPATLTPQEGPGCLLFRNSNSDVSYAEMIAPCDFGRDELADCGHGKLRLRRRLFAGSLEKGVILRARVRGVFLPRAQDERDVAEAYRALLDSPPPLTT